MSVPNVIFHHVPEQPIGEHRLEVKLEVGDTPLPSNISTEMAEGIFEQEQKKAAERGHTLTDKTRYFFKSVTGNTLTVLSGTYSHFIATRVTAQDAFERLKDPSTREAAFKEIEPYLSTGYGILGVGAVITTNNNDILLQLRSGKVTQGQGLYHIPSGGFMPEHSSGNPNPFDSIRQQVFDEQGLNEMAFQYIGDVADLHESPNHTLIFQNNGKTYSREEIDQAFIGFAPDRYETEKLRFIPGDEESLLRMMSGGYVDSDGTMFRAEETIILSALGAMAIWGKNIYGDDWYSEAKSELQKNTRF